MANVPNGVKILPVVRGLSRAHERYRQTDGRRHIANVNVSSRSLKQLKNGLFIVLITDYCWRSWMCGIAAPYKSRVDLI